MSQDRPVHGWERTSIDHNEVVRYNYFLLMLKEAEALMLEIIGVDATQRVRRARINTARPGRCANMIMFDRHVEN